MNKAAVEKALTKGSVKQRALLLANHLAETSVGGKGLLTANEFQALAESFRSEQELKAYNRYRKMFDSVRIFLTNLSQYRLAYKEVIERLDKLLIIRRNNANVQDLINKILTLIPNKKEKAKALRLAERFANDGLLRTVNVSKEPEYVFVSGGLNPLNGQTLDQSIQELQEAVKIEQRNLKTALQAIKDYLNETDFNVKVFWAFIKEVENWSKSKKDKGFTILIKEAALNRLEKPSLRPLIEKDFIEPDYEDVSIDIEKYQQYRQECLNV